MKQSIITLLPKQLADVIRATVRSPSELTEIRLRSGRGLLIDTVQGERMPRPDGQPADTEERAFLVTDRLLSETLELLTGFSIYSFEEEIKQGYFTVRGGHRIGVAGQTVCQRGQVVGIKNIAFLNIRVAKECINCAAEVFFVVHSEAEVYSTLLVSPPGCGKTTMLRDLARLLSESGYRVSIADERSEIAAGYLSVPQLEVGLRTDVMSGCKKSEAMYMLIRSMTPQVVIADEIGGMEDAIAVETAARMGCSVIASAHGRAYEDLFYSPVFAPLMKNSCFKRFVMLKRTSEGFFVSEIRDETGAVLFGKKGKEGGK